MSAHTPGPWFQEDHTVYALNEDGTNRFSLRLQHGFVQQRGSNVVQTGDDELCANAALIHASPDLLDVCREVLAIWNEGTRGNRPFPEMALRAAIAKAEGKP